METLKQLDEKIFLYLNNLGTEKWDGFWIIMTDQWMSIPLYAFLMFLIYKKTNLKSAFVSLATILAMMVVVYGISQLAKYGVARPRPCNMGFDMRFPLALKGKECGEYGFFSTHASSGMALILFTGLILKKYYRYILIPLFIWLAFFCYSRIYVGKHYLGDIIAGLLVGLIVGYLFYKLRLMITKKYNV